MRPIKLADQQLSDNLLCLTWVRTPLQVTSMVPASSSIAAVTIALFYSTGLGYGQHRSVQL
jgi:hypothetical protein